jgi:hypothetical protein
MWGNTYGRGERNPASSNQIGKDSSFLDARSNNGFCTRLEAA